MVAVSDIAVILSLYNALEAQNQVWELVDGFLQFTIFICVFPAVAAGVFPLPQSESGKYRSAYLLACLLRVGRTIIRLSPDVYGIDCLALRFVH